MVRSAPKPLRERSERQRIPQDDRNLLECAEIMLQCIFTSHEELRSTPLFTPKNLMSLISSLQVLMDTAVAGEFTKDFPVKLPASLFRDILLDPHSGCLRQIMEKALLFVHTRLSDSSFGNLRRLELHTAKTQNESVDLLPELYKTSVEAGLWKPPLVFIAFRKENPDLAKMCATRIRELGGRVGTGAWTQCSHLLLDVRISDDNEIFTRKVRIPTNDGADRCLTHYWYFPDSFDSGVFSSALPKETTLENPPENQKPEDGVWRVGIEWLEVSHRYREWANELDFEVPNDLMSLEFHIPEISDEEKDRPGKPDRPPTKPDKSAKVEKNDSPIVEKTPRRATRSHGVDSEYSPSETSQVSINRTPSPERKRPAPPLSARNKRHRFEQSGSDNLVISIACTPLPKVATAALILGSPALPDELPPLPPWDNELVAKDWLCKQQAVALAALGDDGFRRGIAPRVRRGPGRPPKQETFVWFYEQQADFLAEINALLGRDTSQGLENFSSAIASVGGAAPARWESGRLPTATFYRSLSLEASSLAHCMIQTSLPAEVIPPLIKHPTRTFRLPQEDVQLHTAMEFQEPPEGCVELPPVELPEPAPPTLPAWWEPDAVSDLERRLLGQYCCGVYQPLYLQVRETILQLYQANPSRYLTFTGVRKRIGGDCSLLLRIFSLMEYTGVINQHAKSRPPGFKKMAVLPQSDAAELCFSCRQQVGKTVYVPPVPTMPLTICSDCYDSGRTMYIPKEFFTRVVKETQWNETRLQALVRAVHQNDDWDQVAQVVSATDPTAPVSREDCLLKFSKLPIEDVLLEVQSRSPQFLRVLLAHAPPELVNAVFDACLETPNDSWCSVLSHNRRLNVQIPVELKTAVGAVHVQQREAVDNLGETLKCADDMACLVDSLVACDDALQAARRSLLSLLQIRASDAAICRELLLKARRLHPLWSTYTGGSPVENGIWHLWKCLSGSEEARRYRSLLAPVAEAEEPLRRLGAELQDAFLWMELRRREGEGPLIVHRAFDRMAPFKLSHLSHKAMLEARVDFGGYLPLSRDQVSCLDSRGFIDKLESGNDSSPSLSSEHLSREDSATSPRSAPVAALRPNEQVVHPNGRAQYLAAEGEFLAQSAYWHRKMEELLQFPRPVLLIIDINNEDLHAVALDMFSVDRAACKKSAKETVTRLLPSEISCLRLFIMEHECSYVYSIYSIISYINERKITFSTKSCNEARVRAFRTDDEQKRLLGQQPIPKRRRL